MDCIKEAHKNMHACAKQDYETRLTHKWFVQKKWPNDMPAESDMHDNWIKDTHACSDKYSKWCIIVLVALHCKKWFVVPTQFVIVTQC